MSLLKRAKDDPMSDPTSLGSLLIESGRCTKDQLQAAYDYQTQNRDILIGEVLIKMGVINQSIMDEILARQKVLRKSTAKNVAEYVQVAAKHTLILSGSLDSLADLSNQVLLRIK